MIEAFPSKNCGAVPRKCDMAGVIAGAWKTSLSMAINQAYFAEAGRWPVDKERALQRLQRSRRKTRDTDRPPLHDVPIAVSHDGLEELIGSAASARPWQKATPSR